MRRAAAIIVLLCATGCVGTPLPQPPALEAPRAERIDYDVTGSTLRFFGAPGTVAPGIPTLWVVDLDAAEDPLLVPVAADGSFASGLAVRDGDEIRMQARDGDARSRPVDVRVPVSGEIVRPTEGCLLLDPPFELRFDDTSAGAGSEGVILVTNTCGVEARIETADLRRPARFAVSTTVPLVIPDGGSAELTIEFTPGSSGLHEEILFLQVSSPEADRRPITLEGSSP